VGRKGCEPYAEFREYEKTCRRLDGDDGREEHEDHVLVFFFFFLAFFCFFCRIICLVLLNVDGGGASSSVCVFCVSVCVCGN
jgi:hypothetical protein